MRHAPSQTSRQRGVALVFVLVMMTLAIGLAVITARTTVLGDKATRNERDRQIAFQSAELALNDAELDIMDPDAGGRACELGAPLSSLGSDEGCSSLAASRGLCGPPADASRPIYEQVNWEETNDADRAYVRFGEITGRDSQLQIGTGVGPARPPKYIIVRPVAPMRLVVANRPFKLAGAYRVYAIGYGANPETQVMLEAQILKPILDKACTSGTGL